MRVKAEYFGPSKKFTANKESDIFDIRSNKLTELMHAIGERYGVEFLEYIVTSCGVVVGLDYLELNTREWTHDTMGDELGAKLESIFGDHEVEDDATVVIVPPVSSG